jgi:MFS transporter, ACS family, solute carrier family 17 (sodium-dependent inorganic phosphate cotransporter), other
MKTRRSQLMPTIFLCFGANVLCFLDRVNISIAAPFIMQQYGWDETRMGIIFSAFFAGYVIFMIPGGVLADRFGAYKVLVGGVAFWSLFTYLTPFFSRIGTMSVCRYLVGTGQGVNFPCISNFIARQVPMSHRAKVQGFTLSGITVGIVIGLPVGSWIISKWGWQAIFYVFGIAGGFWIFFWLYLARSVTAEPLQSPGTSREAIPWGTLLGNRSALGLSCSYFCHNYAGYLFLVWLPTYLIQVHGFSIAAMGIGAAAPPLASGIFMNVSGWFSDYLIKKGKSPEFSRKLLLYSGMGGSGLLLFLLPWISEPYLVVGLLTISSAAKAVATPVYWTLAVDMAPRHSGILSSIMNTSGNVAGIAASAITGWIVACFADWNLAILLGAGITLLGVGIAAFTIRVSEIV